MIIIDIVGDAILIQVLTAVDTSNSSYYGDSNLYFVRADNSISCKVPLDKQGPIHDAKWCPIQYDHKSGNNDNGGGFLVCHGFMPSSTILFNDKCEPVWDLGTGSYNMIAWDGDGMGRFFILGGFGNLPGDIAFYERKGDNSCKVIR